jgi:molybdopterin adenylyltransferase
MPIRVAILTISDACSRGERKDTSGDTIVAWASARTYTIADRALVPDETVDIVRTLTVWCDDGAADLVLTTGGTGLAPRDVTPEATRSVIERDAPGFAEAMRTEGARHTPMGILTRGVSGVAGQTLIVNFPGSPKAIDQLFGVLEPTLAHVVQTLRGDSSHGH